MTSERKIKLITNPECKPYFEAAAAGKLLIGSCSACGKPHFYPRSVCPHCGSEDTNLVEASGNGVIYSYSVTRQAKPPYVIAYVTLDEGVTMLTNIIDCNIDDVRIGQKVKAKFVEAEEGGAVPMFVPA